MVTGLILPCRFDSKRLPGKALREVHGQPLLSYVLEACHACGEQVVVATTERTVDDPIAVFCRDRGVAAFRGDLDDVAGRLLSCSRAFAFDFFFRANGDSPFVDPDLVRRARNVAASGSFDLVTNLKPRSYPYGMSVELVRTEAFEKAHERMSSPEDLEHVTRYLYRYSDEFPYHNIEYPDGEDFSDVRLTIDESPDLDRFANFVEQVDVHWPHVELARTVAFYRETQVDP